MNRRLERSGSAPLRVLVVGSAAWRGTASAELSDGDGDDTADIADAAGATGTAEASEDVAGIEIVASVSSSNIDLDDRTLDSCDCILTNDRATLSALDDAAGTGAAVDDDSDADPARSTDCPIVYAIDPEDDIEPARVLDAGAAEVITESTLAVPELLERRLRNACLSRRDRRAESSARTIDRSDEWYRLVMTRSSDLQLVFAADGTVTFASPSADEIADADTATRLGEFVDGVHPDDRGAVCETFEAVRSAEPGSDSVRTVEYRYRRDDSVRRDADDESDGDSDGGWRIHEATLTNRLDDVGGVVASIEDVTDRRHVERELDESVRRVTDAFYALDTSGRVTYLNDRAVELIGRDRSEILGEHVFEAFPEAAGTPFEDAAVEAMETGEPRTVERYSEPADRWVEVRLYPSSTGLSVYFRDVTDRVERERRLDARTERLRAIVDTVPMVLYAFDADGTITLAEGRAFETLDATPNDLLGRSIFDVLDDGSRGDDVDEAIANAETLLDGTPIHDRGSFEDRVFETWGHPVVEDGTVDRVIGIAVDVTERVRYRTALNAIHDATRRLVTAESMDEAGACVVDAAADVLDCEAVHYRFDDRENELVPGARSADFESVLASPSRVGPGDRIAWRTFVDGTPVTFDDVREAVRVDVDAGENADGDANANATTNETEPEDAVAESDTDATVDADAGAGLCVPLGEYGVLVAVSADVDAYGDEAIDLAQSLATTAETALDRIGRTRRLHERERELERQNDHLERLTAANRVRQDLEQRLLLAESRTEIERGMCDRLAETDACSMAWTGAPEPGGNQLRDRVRAGRDRGYLDGVTVTTVDDSAAEPAGRAARTGEPVYVENIAEAVHDGAWRAAALSDGFQSVYAVPLVHDEFLYGVLALYGDERDAFDEPFRSMLAELSESIAYTTDAVNRKNAMRGDDVVEVELAIEDGDVLSRLADRIGRRLTLEGATTREDGPVLFAAIEGSAAEFAEIADDDGRTDDEMDDDDAADALARTVAAVDGVGTASIIATTDRKVVMQLELTAPFLGSIVEPFGGAIREFSADGTGSETDTDGDDVDARAVIGLPDAVELREVLAEIERRGIAASMIARRDEPSGDPRALDVAARDSLLDDLTDRQREVVQTAYHGGFFDWPRETTGESIASSLDISPPAFHKHVRSAERKVFGHLFTDDAPSG